MQSKLVKQNKFRQQKTVCEIENKTNKMNFDLTLQKKTNFFQRFSTNEAKVIDVVKLYPRVGNRGKLLEAN